MSGIKDVAIRAGVSISTVSNVLNKSKYVSPELVERVEKAVNELGYEVNSIAASMKSKKSGIIGIITEDICGVFYPYIIKEINTIADEKGYKVIICDVKGEKGEMSTLERERSLFQKLLAYRVDGIIFASSIPISEQDRYFIEIKKLADYKYKKTPIVSLERNLTMLGIDSVYFDSYQNAYKAVNHLVDCGCKKICHIAGPTELQIVLERMEGYEKCLADNKLNFDRSNMIAHGDYTHKGGYIAMNELLNNVPDLDGVFCSNDQMAIGALKYLKESGKNVPDDIKLIGYDDVFVSSIVEPSISTIHIKKHTAGRKAARILFDRIENPEISNDPIGIQLDGRLVVRKSTVKDVEEEWNLSDW